MPSVRDYVALGEQALRELLEAEHAVVWQEVEAKIADRPWHTQTKPVNHLTTARQNLLAHGVITEEQ